MAHFSQGNIIKIGGYRQQFLIVSKNAFIRATGMFHVCPLMEGLPEGALHIPVTGNGGTKAVAVCEEIKLIDPAARGCTVCDRIPYAQLMDISDAIQGIFEYD